MNPSLLEHFAAHEQLSESDSQHAEFLAPDRPTAPSGYAEWEATWRARLRFIRARAMHEEAMFNRPPEQIAALYDQVLWKEPAPPKTTGLTFSEALVAMKGGRGIKMTGWDQSCAFRLCPDGEVRDANDTLPHLSWRCIFSECWEVVP